MAQDDSANLLARLKLLVGRDKFSSDSSMTDANYYGFLTDGQAHWKPKVAAEYPYHMFEVPTKMTTSDNVTFTFGTDAAPLAIEVYDRLAGQRLTAGQFDDSSSDYVWEGANIRMPMNVARSFSDGPYARWVAAPTTIDGSTQPTLKPAYARQLIVCRAAILWASRGGQRDPQPFRDLETETWNEVQQSLKNSNMFFGDAANRSGRRVRGLSYLYARGR